MGQPGIVARAPGKVILAGEHFVVHGAPALAVPVSRHVQVEVIRTPGEWRVADEAMASVRGMLRCLGEEPESLTVRIDATLPFGSGLGGSAALAVALVRATGEDDVERVRAQAHELEKLAHGMPSGIDDTVAAYNKPVRYVRGGAPEVVDVPDGLPLWIGLTPSGASTLEAVANVQRLSETRPEFFSALLGEAIELVDAAQISLRHGDWRRLGALMRRNHDLLVDIGVSTPLLNELVDAAMAAGAHGAKLTGGGLGGAMLALAPAELPMNEVLLAHGAVAVIGPDQQSEKPDV